MINDVWFVHEKTQESPTYSLHDSGSIDYKEQAPFSSTSLYPDPVNSYLGADVVVVVVVTTIERSM
jgi:hypothetical protein